MITFSMKFLTRASLIALLIARTACVDVNATSEEACPSQKHKINRPATTRAEQKLVSDACNKIQDALNNEYHPKEGSPTRVLCVYKLHNGDKVQEEVKTYLSGYHAKKHYDTKTFNESGASTPDQIIEIAYKPNTDHISLVYKDPKRHNKRVGNEKEVKIVTDFVG